MNSFQPKRFSITEVRKIHPKAGMKWSEEEDIVLQKKYKVFQSNPALNFDDFIFNQSAESGRTVWALKTRLAKYFSDVPGWDYEQQNERDEELNKQVSGVFTLERDQLLLTEYKKYLEFKRETFIHFTNRLSVALGQAPTKIVRYRLAQLVEVVVKYTKADVSPFNSRSQPQAEKPIPSIDLAGNPKFRQALELLEKTNNNIFLTGEAGTGKSTLLQYFRRTTSKNVVVLAPTGVAALNVEGQTVHSFCGFGPDITLQKVKRLVPYSPKRALLQKLDTIIIDEISMVRADLLDCVDKFLRLNGKNFEAPFGGIQMVFVGDLYQLPPVEKDFVAGDSVTTLYNSPYFFDAKAFGTTPFTYMQLDHIYRQQDLLFIEVLNAVRNNAASQAHLETLNQRAQTENQKFTFQKFAIYLTPTNARAKQVNNFFLERLSTTMQTYQGTAFGTFEEKELPTDLDLQVKVGAQVMMLNNDQRKRWVNGTMGRIVGTKNVPLAPVEFSADEEEFQDDFPTVSEEDQGPPSTSEAIVVELETGETLYVTPHTWEMYQFTLDKQTQKIDSKVTGTFTQYPFKLAWAVTIHKAQGKTFDKVYIDLSTGTFAHGQLYVALSRCRTLQGIYLKRPIVQEDIILDPRIATFLNQFKIQQ